MFEEKVDRDLLTTKNKKAKPQSNSQILVSTHIVQPGISNQRSKIKNRFSKRAQNSFLQRLTAWCL